MDEATTYAERLKDVETELDNLTLGELEEVVFEEFEVPEGMDPATAYEMIANAFESIVTRLRNAAELTRQTEN